MGSTESDARPLRALVVEDSDQDAELLLLALRRARFAPEVTRVWTHDDFCAALSRERWDVVLSDFAMPEFSGADALRLLRARDRELPFILVSGTLGEDVAVEMMRAGANDFVVKGKLARLGPAIARELQEAHDRRERAEERRREEEARERLLAELSEAVRARDVFLSLASHELKTPLTALLLQLESVARGSARTPDDLASRVTTMARQAARLGALVDNLLDVGRIATGHIALSRADVDLAELVAEGIEHAKRMVPRCASSVERDLTTVRGSWDPLRLQTVVAQLVSNAFKFGRGRPVLVSVRAAGDAAILAVADRGIGIPDDVKARLFGKFERAVPEWNYGGFGLGLWTARRIVEAHGGAIRVESRHGEGSTFTVELPVHPVPASELRSPRR